MWRFVLGEIQRARARALQRANGSDAAIKQHVWGTQYIDELIQIREGSDYYWAVQDANYNPSTGSGP